MNRPYWTSRGSLKPRRWRNSLTSLAWMSMGRKRRTGSPPRRTRKKTAVRARKITSAVWPRRDRRYARTAGVYPMARGGAGGRNRALGAEQAEYTRPASSAPPERSARRRRDRGRRIPCRVEVRSWQLGPGRRPVACRRTLVHRARGSAAPPASASPAEALVAINSRRARRAVRPSGCDRARAAVACRWRSLSRSRCTGRAKHRRRPV